MISREFSSRETSPCHDLPGIDRSIPFEEAKRVLALGSKLLMKPEQDRKAWKPTWKMVERVERNAAQRNSLNKLLRN